MKNLVITLLIALATGLSGFVLMKKDQSAPQTEEYALVRYQEMGKRSIVAVYYADRVEDKSGEFVMNKILQGPNLDKIVIVLEELNREGFTMVSATTSNGIYQGTGGFNGIYFVMKRPKVN